MTQAPAKVMSGSYQDYLNGDIASKIFRFRLLKKNMNPSFVDDKGRPKLYPEIYDMPSTAIVQEFDPVKKQWVQKVIRYIPGESSIYKEEQSNDKDVPKKNFKIRFERGEKTISGVDRLLLEFMMKCNLNATNPNKRADVQPLFELVDTDKFIKEQMSKDEALDEAKYFCRKGDWDEVRALAMVYGLSQSFTVEETRWNLRAIAERDPVKFLNSKKDPKMKMKYHVLEAIEKGLLVTNAASNSIAWVTNRDMPIYTAAIGRDIIDGFVNQLSTPEGKMLYNSLLEFIYPPEEEVSNLVIPTREQIQQAKSIILPKEPMLKNSPLEDEKILKVVEKALEKGLATAKGNMPWITYKGEKYRQKDGLVEYLKGNETELLELAKQVD